MTETVLKILDNNEVLIGITEEYPIRTSLMITTTTKEWVILCGGIPHQTDDFNRTIRRLINQNPNVKYNEIHCINAKKYQEHLNKTR